MNLDQRCAGTVLHLTSLPGPHGSGDLGDAAHAFVAWMARAGLSVWQTLPLAPIGPGDSPYQSPSAFAGNTLLVALEPLVERGWLDAAALETPGFGAAGPVDFRRVIPWRLARLREAARGFAARATPAARAAFAAWRTTQAHWLDEYTLFTAIKASQGLRAWWQWPAGLRHRDAAALAGARAALAADIEAEAFAQWQFDVQLALLKRAANEQGVRLMGDVPIFIAHDSADVWARRELVRLGPDDQPAVVSGVPPDGYSPDGQRWGTPLYDWAVHEAEGFDWWTARVQRVLSQADVFRIDHFRGFAACWEIPAECPTARDGAWVPAPGHALFEAIERKLGRLPIVAEDLGYMTDDVVGLRDRFGFPGMRIVYEGLMSADPAHGFLPQHHERRMLAYTSTHDSDTVRGWWDGTADTAQRAFAVTLLGPEAQHDIAWAVLRATFASVANMALAPLQDLLGLGSAHRMNRPGTAEGNWAWRFDASSLDDALADRVAALVRASARSVPAREPRSVPN
jgi:4-alpha-glucanotransferase